MFKLKTTPKTTALEIAVDRLLESMKTVSVDTEEYANMVDHLVKLHNLKEAEKPEGMSTDTKATMIANLAGILLILNHERAGIVTSKAVSFIMKLR
jgi:hypothetical protein